MKFIEKLIFAIFFLIASSVSFAVENPTSAHDWHNNKHGVGIIEGGIGCPDSICVQATYTGADNGGQKQGFNLHTQLPESGGNISYNPGSWTNDLDEKDQILQSDKTRYVGQQQPEVTINYHGNFGALLGTGKATYEGQNDASGIEKLTVQGAPTGVYTFQGQGQYRADESINGYLPDNHPDHKNEPPNSPVSVTLEYGTNRHGFFKEVQQSGSYAPVIYSLGEGQISGATTLTFEANTGGPHGKYADLGLNLGVIHSAGFDEKLARQIQSDSWFDKADSDVIAAVARGNVALAAAKGQQIANAAESSKVVRGIATTCVGEHCKERVEGVVNCASGAVQAGAGAAVVVGTGWTGVGLYGGGYVALRGADTAQAGCRQAYTGKITKTLTAQGLESIGLSENTASIVEGLSSGNVKQIGQNVVGYVTALAIQETATELGVNSTFLEVGSMLAVNKKNAQGFEYNSVDITKKDLTTNTFDKNQLKANLAEKDLSKVRLSGNQYVSPMDNKVHEIVGGQKINQDHILAAAVIKDKIQNMESELSLNLTKKQKDFLASKNYKDNMQNLEGSLNSSKGKKSITTGDPFTHYKGNEIDEEYRIRLNYSQNIVDTKIGTKVSLYDLMNRVDSAKSN